MRAAIWALLLAGCGGAGSGDNRGAPADTAVAPASPERPAEAAPAPEPVLTAEGFGPLRIGMTRAEVVKALGEDDDPEAVGGPAPASCDEFRPARAPEGMLVMIEEGRLTRISLIDASKVKTDRGLGLGATAAEVRAPYGSALQSGPHKYEEAPAEYLSALVQGPAEGREIPGPGDGSGNRLRGGREGGGAVDQRRGAEHSLC